jgi:cell division protein FtsI/penicillin-binding protein 2
MRLHWLLALILSLPAPASAGQDGVDPAVRVPVAMAGLELPLPPGVRPRAAPGVAAAGPGVERVPGPPGSGGWLELEYTVDPELDQRVRQVVRRSGLALAHVILMDAESGEVLSYVSTSPEAFPPTRTYPTASLMKVVTAAAVLRNRPEAAKRDCHYVGSPYRVLKANLSAPSHGGRAESFWRALALSNNQCFAQLAVHDVGKPALLAEMKQVGLLEAPAPRHPPGQVLPISSDLELGYLGSGLGGSFVTPLGAARLAAVLAGGRVVQPYWVGRVRDAHGNTLATPGRQAPRRAWPVPVTEELRELMVAVTERGTARSAFRDGRGQPLLGSIRVSGKTGTLSGDDPKGVYHWFIGVAPADAPRVAVASVVVNGRSGSAAQVAARSLHALLCEGSSCDTARVDALRARAVERDAGIVAEILAQQRAARREPG